MRGGKSGHPVTDLFKRVVLARRWLTFVTMCLSFAVFGVGTWRHSPEFWATFSVPLFVTLLLLGSQVFIGFVSKVQPDAEREAAARFNAWLMILIVGWIGTFGVALYGPLWIRSGVHSTKYLVALATSGAGAGLLTAILGAAATTPASGGTSSGGF